MKILVSVRKLAHSSSLALWKFLLLPILFFTNNEDGQFGDNRWNPERKKDFKTAFLWWLRNPAHDLYFHVIGFTDKRTRVVGPHAPSITNTSDEGWNFHFVFPNEIGFGRLFFGLIYALIGTAFEIHILTGIGIVTFFAGLPFTPFPFVSYVSKETLVDSAYAGWRPSGAFGFKYQMNRELAKKKKAWVAFNVLLGVCVAASVCYGIYLTF